MANNKKNQTHEPIDREKILKQRKGLEATLKNLLNKAAFYEGAIASLDYLLDPEAEQMEPEAAPVNTD